MKEIDYLRGLYLADLRKIVNYGGKERPRIRHVGNWERLPAQVGAKDGYRDPATLYEDYNVWIWSDTHFFHKNIIGFSERPYDDIEQMNEQMVLNYNEYVQEDDVCIWVGDVGFGNDTQINELINRCNGYKILVVGNHDFNRKKLRHLDFDEVHLIYNLPTPEGDLVMTHYPMDNIEDPWFNLHGHLHVFPKHDTGHPLHMNVNCELMGYRPDLMEDVCKRVRMRKISAEI